MDGKGNGTIRELFLEACNQIAAPFVVKGFKATKQGQCLKKISNDKDITFEIFFRSSTLNNPAGITIYPIISLYSKNLKAQMAASTNGLSGNGLIYTTHLGYITPLKQYKEWELAGLSRAQSVNSITDLLNRYAIPVFELFEDRNQAIEYMATQGCRFNSFAEDSLLALPFVFFYGGRDKAERYFNEYMQITCSRKRFIGLFARLEKVKEINWNEGCGFMEGSLGVFAFVNGLKIK